MNRSYGTFIDDIILPRTKVLGYKKIVPIGTKRQRTVGSATIVGMDFSPSLF